MQQDDSNFVTLIDENDEEIEFEHLMTVSHKGDHYLVLHPVDSEDEGETVIMGVAAGEDDEETYFELEDMELAQEIFDEFLALLDDEDDEDEDE